MSKTTEWSEELREMPARERAVVDDFLQPIRRHLDQGAVNLARLARLAFETALGAKDSRQTKLGLAIARGLEARQKLTEAEGGSLSSEEVARLLGISKTAVLKRLHTGKLLAWREERLQAARFPRWQFTERGQVLKGLPKTLELLQENEHLDAWAKVLFFLQKKDQLGGKRPLDLLRKGRVNDVHLAAQAYAE